MRHHHATRVPGDLLIVENNEPDAKVLERYFQIRFRVFVHTTARVARERMTGPAWWLGGIFALGLEGSGLDLLDSFRRKEPHAPAMVLTQHADRSIANLAQSCGAQVVVKPLPSECLDAFAGQVERYRNRDLGAVVWGYAEARGLSPGQARILFLSAAGVPRKNLARVLEIAEDTLKMQIKRLLTKCGDPETLTCVVQQVWQTLSGVEEDRVAAWPPWTHPDRRAGQVGQ